MTGYQIFKTDGTLLETINVRTVDNKGYSSLTLLGQGIPNYGAIIAADMLWLLENFSNSDPPVNPLEGQLWWGAGGGSWATRGGAYVYDGDRWEKMLTEFDGISYLAPAVTIDFTVAGSTTIFSGENFNIPSDRTFTLTGLHLMPISVGASVGPTFNVSLFSAEDVLPNQSLSVPTSQEARFITVSDWSVYSDGSSNMSLNVTVPASGGNLVLSVKPFGVIRLG